MRTRYREALRLLESGPERTARTYGLMGKCFYRLREFSKATDALETAVEAEPLNANYWDWLGKAYGIRAEIALFVTAPRYATRAREHFERAVSLDPRNRTAWRTWPGSWPGGGALDCAHKDLGIFLSWSAAFSPCTCAFPSP